MRHSLAFHDVMSLCNACYIILQCSLDLPDRTQSQLRALLGLCAPVELVWTHGKRVDKPIRKVSVKRCSRLDSLNF